MNPPDTYNDWVDRMMAGREAKPVEDGEVIRASAGAPFGTIEFLRMDRPKYVGEVGKKGGDYVFHFFPKEGESLPPNFEEKMGDAFLEMFKFQDRVQSIYTEELSSWAVRAVGYANNPLADDLAIKVFDVLDKLLG